jgi:hypothetical protein
MRSLVKDWLFPSVLFVVMLVAFCMAYDCASDDCAARGGKLVQTSEYTYTCFAKGVVVE